MNLKCYKSVILTPALLLILPERLKRMQQVASRRLLHHLGPTWSLTGGGLLGMFLLGDLKAFLQTFGGSLKVN
jgi:hypothetical protein